MKFNELVEELRASLSASNDEEILTIDRAGTLVNRAQRAIVMANPGLRDVHTVDKTSWVCKTGQYEYQLTDFTNQPVAHILRIRYIDATNKNYHVVYPYVDGLEKFDSDYPYPLDSDQNAGEPQQYVVRGKTVEVIPVPGSSQDGARLWVDYDILPRDMTGAQAPALTNFDEGIVELAKAYGLRLMAGRDQRAQIAAREQRQFAWEVIGERMAGEADYDTIDQMADYGP